MASICKTFLVDAPPGFVWDALRDVGALHTRLVRGFVDDTRLEGDTRTVTFANGMVVQEQIVTVDDAAHRLVYRAIGGRATHHNASVQVLPAGPGQSTLVWTTDLLPDAMRDPIAQMVELGAAAMRHTLETDSRSQP